MQIIIHPYFSIAGIKVKGCRAIGDSGNLLTKLNDSDQKLVETRLP